MDKIFEYIPSWALLSIVSAVFFGLGDFIVVSSQASKIKIIPLYVTYTILIGILNLMYMIFFMDVKQVLSFNKEQWIVVVLLCVTYFAAYILHFISLQKAPNPGYANALVMGHVILLTTLSYMYLSKPLNYKTVIGIGMMLVGAGMVTLYSG